MKKVGLTGGMGSGKSTVAEIFKVFGVPVFFADDEGKKCLGQEDVKNKIVQEFGQNILDDKQDIDRKALAGIVFNDEKALKKLNNIIHPEVEKRFKTWLSKNQDEDYIIHEAAILFESGFYKMFDKIIAVSAPEEVRIKRLVKRDQSEAESLRRRMRFQLSEKERNSKSDFVIYNDGEQLIIPQTLRIHNTLKNQAY
ncbi:MAG: dephospho-CoA kinase [Bacteroidales bacterium]|nr:dephospho-CoA kinase [Bacteroidales bacterium]MCF8350756.1 dephospho-CoA kinase [Bacteroidales bacterium]MCF8377177.1 dephospho-CoA kinase [Bacteroidales bacterium]MCF8402226.1 dephospho-CoA kinase [Bacteroidales bacterium]